MSNYDALLTLIGDINNAFCHLEEEDVADICDGDIKLLDKAVKRFKSTVWENQVRLVAQMVLSPFCLGSRRRKMDYY